MLEIFSPEDFNRREAYRDEVDPKSTQLIAVLAPYNFKERIRCGLSNCHTPHNFGYLIRTADGRETNIGNKCGRKHFGSDFVIQRDIEEKRRKRFLQMQALKVLQERRDELLRRISGLKNGPFGVTWLQRSKRAFRNEVTVPLFQQLVARAKRGDVVVSDIRERSEKEIKRLQELNPGLKREKWRYEATPVGSFVGLEALAIEIDAIFGSGLENMLDTFFAIDIDTLSNKDLSLWANWSNGIENAFQQTEVALAAGRHFFQKANFELLPYLTIDRRLKIRLTDLAWNVEKGGPAKYWA